MTDQNERCVGFCALSLVLALSALAFDCKAQDVAIPREDLPPTTFTGLRQLKGPQPTELCFFPSISMSVDSLKTIALSDSAILRFPADWQKSPLLPGDDEHTHTRLALPGGNRILIQRQRRVAHGRPYLMYRPDELAEGTTCSIARDQAGAIWSFYQPDPADTTGALKYTALGDVITPAGFWYTVLIWTTSAAEQFRLADILTQAMLLSQR